MDLVQRLGAGLVSAALHRFESAERLHRDVVALRYAGRLTGLHRPGGGDRINDVGLAEATPDLPVRPGDLDDLDVVAGQVPGRRSHASSCR